MSDRVATDAVGVIARSGRELSGRLLFDWPEAAQSAVQRLHLDVRHDGVPALAGIVGGASSGKSTVFNNLLGGHLASRVAARGHITLGPILACHERHRATVERLLTEGVLLPGFERKWIELDDNVTGSPGELAIVFHAIDAVADVVLVDLPDFTSDRARSEGDVALALLPWFDRVLVVVDPERWFDRQSFSVLRAESVRFGQDRWALFNRTQEGPLGKSDRDGLRKQAERLGAEGLTVLEFRRGRGFRLFPPDTLTEVRQFLERPGPQRSGALMRFAGECANRVLNQNRQRSAALAELRKGLDAAVARTLPSDADCIAALLTPEERKQLAVMWRVLRLDLGRRWLSSQTQRVYGLLGRVPLLGSLLPGSTARDPQGAAEAKDRMTIGRRYLELMLRRQRAELERTVKASVFWHEIRAWLSDSGPGVGVGSGESPRPRAADLPPPVGSDPRGALPASAARAVEAFDGAVARWTTRVQSECQGMAPHVKGAVGIGAVALAVVLIAAPGPVTALTLVSGKAAIAGALSHLLAASGAGGLFGKQLAGLVSVVQERLMGSAEFRAVQEAAGDVRGQVELAARRLAEQARADAAAFVLADRDPLAGALHELSRAAEEMS